MIVSITGNNHYLMKKRLDSLTADFVQEHGDLALEKLDGEEVEPSQLIDAVQNLPFLSTRKMVVVRNLSANKTVAETIEQIISAAHEGIDLILYEPQIDKRTSYYKVLKAKTSFEEYTDLDAQGLAKWLAEEAKSLGGSIGFGDAGYLIDRVGTGQVMLANELNKLVTYEPKITRQTIDLLTVKTPQSKIFDLLDVAFTGNKAKALELYDEQRAQKVEAQEIIAMFAWQLRLIAAISLANGRQPGEIAKDLGMSPYPVAKAMNLARRLDKQKIANMVGDLLEIDSLSKTKPIDLDEALKAYIINL